MIIITARNYIFPIFYGFAKIYNLNEYVIVELTIVDIII